MDAVRYADMFGPVIDFCWGIGAMMLYLVGVRFLGFEKGFSRTSGCIRHVHQYVLEPDYESE